MQTQKALLTHTILEKQGSKMDETDTSGMYTMHAPAADLLKEVGKSSDNITEQTGG